MVLIGEVVESVPGPTRWTTALRIPYGSRTVLLPVYTEEEWAAGSEVRIEIEFDQREPVEYPCPECLVYDPLVVRHDDIGAYKAEREAVEDVIQRFWKGGF